MVRIIGDGSFDWKARDKHDSALKVLVRAADAWSVHGREAVDLDYVLAVLLRIFLARGFGEKSEARALEFQLVVGTPQQEAVSRIPAAEESSIVELLEALRAQLSFAQAQWLLGNPEQPPTTHALNAIEHVLFMRRLFRRPASPKMPRTLC